MFANSTPEAGSSGVKMPRNADRHRLILNRPLLRVLRRHNSSPLACVSSVCIPLLPTQIKQVVWGCGDGKYAFYNPLVVNLRCVGDSTISICQSPI